MKRTVLLVLAALVCLPVSFTHAQVNVVLSSSGANSDVGATASILSLSSQPTISSNGRYIGIEVGLDELGSANDAAVIVDLQTGTKTLLAQEGTTALPGAGGALYGFILNLVEVNNSGQAFFIHDTDLDTSEDRGSSFWDGSTLTTTPIFEGQSTPAGAPDVTYGSSLDVAQLTNSGDFGGDIEAGPSTTNNDFLQIGSTVLLAGGNAPVAGFTPTTMGVVNGSFSDFSVSAGGADYIAEVSTTDDASTNTYLTVNGVLVAQEGITNHSTPGNTTLTYVNTLETDIADGGQWIAEADSEAGINYALVNGVAVEAEGEAAPDGSSFTSIRGVTINSNGDYVTLWDTSDNDILLLSGNTILLPKAMSSM